MPIWREGGYNPIEVTQEQYDAIQEARDVAKEMQTMGLDRDPYAKWGETRVTVRDTGSICIGYRYRWHNPVAETEVPAEVYKRIAENGRKRLKEAKRIVQEAKETAPDIALESALQGLGDQAAINKIVEAKEKEMQEMLKGVKVPKGINISITVSPKLESNLHCSFYLYGEERDIRSGLYIGRADTNADWRRVRDKINDLPKLVELVKSLVETTFKIQPQEKGGEISETTEDDNSTH